MSVNDGPCILANMFGDYGGPDYRCLSWDAFRGPHYTLDELDLKIRPKNYLQNGKY